MNTGERVRYLRRDVLHLSQSDFAAALHLRQTAVCMMEKRTGVSNRNIAEICKRWGVREEWLRTGEGEVFRQVPAPADSPDDIAIIRKVWPLIYAAADEDERAELIRGMKDACT